MAAKKPKLDCAVAPFTVVIDTREQTPWQFKGIKADADQGGLPLAVPVEVDTLATGDYSIRGLEHEVCIERKSMADLFSSISVGRDRFEREFARMQEMQYAAVVIEAPVDAMLASPPEHTSIDPKIVLRTMMSWSIRYPRVHWWPMPSRAFAELWCFRLLRMYWRNKHEKR